MCPSLIIRLSQRYETFQMRNYWHQQVELWQLRQKKCQVLLVVVVNFRFLCPAYHFPHPSLPLCTGMCYKFITPSLFYSPYPSPLLCTVSVMNLYPLPSSIPPSPVYHCVQVCTPFPVLFSTPYSASVYRLVINTTPSHVLFTSPQSAAVFR